LDIGITLGIVAIVLAVISLGLSVYLYWKNKNELRMEVDAVLRKLQRGDEVKIERDEQGRPRSMVEGQANITARSDASFEGEVSRPQDSEEEDDARR
jgi:hypothetical protein